MSFRRWSFAPGWADGAGSSDEELLARLAGGSGIGPVVRRVEDEPGANGPGGSEERDADAVGGGGLRSAVALEDDGGGFAEGAGEGEVALDGGVGSVGSSGEGAIEIEVDVVLAQSRTEKSWLARRVRRLSAYPEPRPLAGLAAGILTW